MLADGVTNNLRLKPGTKVLLAGPNLDPAAASWILPMGYLNELDDKLEWKDHMCHLFIKYGEKIVLEHHQLRQEMKKMTVKSILTLGATNHSKDISLEMAKLVKLTEVMPTLLDDLAVKLAPDLTFLKDQYFGLKLLGTAESARNS